MEEAYTNRRSTPNRLSHPVVPKRPTSKPPQPSPRTSGLLNISQQEEDDLAKAIKLSLQESGAPQVEMYNNPIVCGKLFKIIFKS